MSEESNENASKAVELIKKAWEVTPSIIISTPDYVYVLFPSSNGTWTEASYLLNEKELETRELSSDQALKYLIEELTKGLPGYIPDITNIIIADEKRLEELVEKIQK
ncbi:MAG: hypothetical protein ACTSSJ_01495 [Candidatus Odinarchaeia archaeon]